MKIKAPISKMENTDKEEFLKVIRADRVINDPMYGEENRKHIETVWQWIQSHLDTAFLQGRESGIKEVDKLLAELDEPSNLAIVTISNIRKKINDLKKK